MSAENERAELSAQLNRMINTFPHEAYKTWDSIKTAAYKEAVSAAKKIVTTRSPTAVKLRSAISSLQRFHRK